MIVGVDPGKSGGIAIDGQVWKTTGCTEIVCAVQELDMMCKEKGEDMIVYIESVHSSPQMGVVSAFSFGQNFGQLHAAFSMVSDSIKFVSPQKWQKALGLSNGISKKSPKTHKRKLKARAQELYPDVKVTGYNQDALLIAYYAETIGEIE